MSQMQTDWNAFWDETPLGTSLPYAGGTLTRELNGGAIWSDGRSPMGLSFDRTTPFEVIAGRSQAIADLWRKQYGYEAPPLTDTGAVFG